jgi:hypothetical protein
MVGKLVLALVVTVAAVSFASAATARASGAAAAPTVSTVATGLDNPRDLTFGLDGRLYVAEAGHGGDDCISGGPGGTTCIGFSSRISRIDTGSGAVTPIATGIVSLADNQGFGATGVDGISTSPTGSIFGIITGSAAAIPNGIPFVASKVARAKAQLGRLIVASPAGGWSPVADVGDVDFAWTAARPDLVPGQFPDANPYGVLAGVGEHWVVDAGSNTLDRVRSNGSVDVVAFFPNPPASDAVPTCIERGPDGALYIGELTGGGNLPGSSIVWRYSVRDRTLTQWATGLTAVTGCGFGTDGRFYAVEFSTLGLDNAAPGTGALVRVAPHSVAPEIVLGGLSFPGGFASAGNALYFSDWSIAPAYTGLGSVKRVTLP